VISFISVSRSLLIVPASIGGFQPAGWGSFTSWSALDLICAQDVIHQQFDIFLGSSSYA
jgi:hypothetical protein